MKVLNRFINKVFKPDFICIGGLVFRRSNIDAVRNNAAESTITVVFRDSTDFTIKCPDAYLALEFYRDAIKELC